MLRTSRTSAVAFSTAGALLAAAAVAAGPAHAAASPGFYVPPASLPAADGALVRSEPMKLGFGASGKATRIMYKSTDSNGLPVAVTGVYLEPSKAWPRTGPRPLIAYAEGTQGQGDRCAPSYGLEYTASSQDGQTNVAYEIPNINGLLGRGLAVVVTDYVGLGTPGRVHTYVNRLDQGHAVLDAARAAQQLSAASITPTSPIATYGYSQGGGASASAAELAPVYAPELNLKAAYAGAPPADLGAVMKTADGTSLTAVIGFAINGFIESYPTLKTVLDRETNPAGKAALAKIAGQCIGDGTLSFGFKKTTQWTTSGKSVSEIVAANPEAQAVVDEQRIGRLKPNVPVRIVTGTKDDIVTHSQVKQLAVDWCALGATVSYVPVDQFFGSGGFGLNHLAPSLSQGEAAQKWIVERLSGTTGASSCGSIASMK